ncbi:serine beta-lactamase-like protein LACTB, mitochondrial isoform X2 [Clavelina lepadiformis]
MEEVGAPGMVVAVSVDGKTVWKQGFGYADVENKVPCTPSTVMRVASISKSFTAMAAARLMEEGKLDLDKNIQEYAQSFPEKSYNGEKVTITLRHLLLHLSGIRHYSKTLDKPKPPKIESELSEYYITKQYSSVTEALALFKDDPLLYKPGEEFLYTTHGWTLISAILEEVSGRDFLSLMQDNFRRLGMNETYADVHNKLIYNRSRYYIRKNGKLENVPYVNNSYKWAGGGFLSTVGDLMKFGNAMMYSYQYKADVSNNNENEENKEKTQNRTPGILKAETVHKMWHQVVHRKRERNSKLNENASYGLGWEVYPVMEQFGCCPKWQLEVCHTGGAIGASSILFLLPDTNSHIPVQGSTSDRENEIEVSLCKLALHSDSDVQQTSVNKDSNEKQCAVKGIAVAIITNMQSVGLTQLARDLAQEFDKNLRSD